MFTAFKTLPVLAIGGIIGAGAFAAVIVCTAISIYYGKLSISEGSSSKDVILPLFSICAISSAIGVGLTAALTSIYPEIFTKWNTAIGAGAVIGAIGLIGGALALEFFMGKPDQSPAGPNHIVERINVTAKGAGVIEGGPEQISVGP